MSDYFTETDAAALLRTLGVPIQSRTLANKRWAGTGPLFVKVGLRVRYRRADLEEYAAKMIGPPVRSTSDVTRARLIAE
ncbi:MAG: hypothetical protein ABL871_14405 [Terricaulis sp.]